MKKILAFFTPLSIAVILVASTCKKTVTTNNCVEKPFKTDCMCAEIYKPVCGCNGKTYPNECHAKCQNITEFKEGECPK